MAFGPSPHNIQLPRLSTNKWWVTRMFDTIQKVEPGDPSVQAASRAIDYMSAIMQIPNGLLATSDSLQRMARVGETALACTWKMTWRDVLPSWALSNRQRVSAATFFHYYPGNVDSVYSHKLKMLMKEQFQHKATHHKFGTHYERGFVANEDDIDLREAEFDEEYIEDRPQDTDTAENDNIII